MGLNFSNCTLKSEAHNGRSGYGTPFDDFGI